MSRVTIRQTVWAVARAKVMDKHTYMQSKNNTTLLTQSGKNEKLLFSSIMSIQSECMYYVRQESCLARNEMQMYRLAVVAT